MNRAFNTKKNISKSAILISSLAALAIVVASAGNSTISFAVQPKVNLGLASSFAVLAGSGITNTGPTTASGTAGADFGSSPTGSFTDDTQVTTTGTKYTAVNAAVTAAKVDLTTAYNDAAGRTPATTVTADLGGQTLTTGVYNSASSLEVTGTLTLDAENDPDAVFIFQAGSTLTTASSATIALVNGADACNVFWQVGSSAVFGTDTVFVGHVMALTSITANTRATFAGQLLASTGAVTLDTNTFTNNLCIEQGGETDTGGQLPNTDAFDWLTPLAIGLGVITVVSAGYTIWRRRNQAGK